MNWLNKIDSVLDNVFVNQTETVDEIDQREKEEEDDNVLLNEFDYISEHNDDYYLQNEILHNNPSLSSSSSHDEGDFVSGKHRSGRLRTTTTTSLRKITPVAPVQQVEEEEEDHDDHQPDEEIIIRTNYNNNTNAKFNVNPNIQKSNNCENANIHDNIHEPTTTTTTTSSFSSNRNSSNNKYNTNTNVKTNMNDHYDDMTNSQSQHDEHHVTNAQVKTDAKALSSSSAIASFNTMKPTTIRLPYRETLRSHNRPNPFIRSARPGGMRPGMIRSVIRYDISDDDSSSNSSSNNNSNDDDNGNEQNTNAPMTTDKINTIISTDTLPRNAKPMDPNNNNNNDKNNNTNNDLLLSNQPSLFVVQTTDQSDDDQISPIASPRHVISTAALRSNQSLSLPTLLHEREQSKGTASISNVHHQSTITETAHQNQKSIFKLPAVSSLPSPSPSPSISLLPPIQTITLPHQHQEQSPRKQEDDEQQDVIGNSSTLSSHCDDDNINNDDNSYRKILHFGNNVNHDIDDDNDHRDKIMTDNVLLDDDNVQDIPIDEVENEEKKDGEKGEEEEEEEMVEEGNINYSSNNGLSALPTINGAINVIQATMGDYLFYDSGNTMKEGVGGNEEDNVDTGDGVNHDEKNDLEPNGAEVGGKEDMDEEVYNNDDKYINDDDDYINEDEDYTIETPLIPWGEDDEVDIIDSDGFSPTRVFDPKWNCHGVVHVKLLRIQHLSMSAGNSLQAVISLPPWKGKIRSETITSYNGPDFAGVCARWDEKIDSEDSASEDNVDSEGIGENQKYSITTQDQGVDLNADDIPCHSMVHTYNNEDTPIPTISIEVHTQQMFNRGIHSFNLSCEPLMRNPGHFRRRWCASERQIPSTPFQTSQKYKVTNDETQDLENESQPSPLILIEACFEPTSFTASRATSKGSDVAIDNSLSVVHVRNESDRNISLQPRERGDTIDSIESLSKRLRVKPHLFRVNTDWRPAYCAVCSTMMFRNGFRCEVCKLDCCEDCQLRVDVELPCGSTIANARIEAQSKSKLSVSKIYSIIAPVKESRETKSNPSSPSISQLKEKVTSKKIEWSEGVGTLRLRIIKACLFQRPFPPESEMSYILKHSDRWLRRGDHYARVSWTDSKETKRTKVVFQTAKPRFDSDELSIKAMHYGTEFRIEVLDASTDASIGSALITTQGLLQWQRDKIANNGGLKLDSILAQDPIDVEKRKIVLELRTGVKSGFGLDFYNSAKLKGSSNAGEISGWIEVETCFDEDLQLYSNSKPKPCPSRPDSDFNMDLIQLHIARIFSIIEDVNDIIAAYLHLVSWKNPALTSLSLFVFVVICFKFNSEYFGSLPFATVIIYMLVFYAKRSKGYREHLQRKEKESSLKEVKGGTVRYNCHRPTGTLKVSVTRGLNLTPQLGLGIPGSLVSTISWDPTKYLDEKKKKMVVDFDPASKALYHLGETESSSVTFNPEWKNFYDSEQLKHLKQLLPNTNFLSRTHSDYIENDDNTYGKQDSLELPVLQPIVERRIDTSLTDEDGQNDSEQFDLVPWEECKGAVVIQIRFSDVLNKLPIFDQILGEVVIPFDSVVNNGIDGWFQVLPKGSMETIQEFPVEERQKKEQKSLLRRLTVADDKTEAEKDEVGHEKVPCVYVKADFLKPSEIDNDLTREISVVVAEHMICNANALKDDKSGFIGSSLQTFNTVRGVTGQVQYLQNQLGKILDWIEIIRNTFNFTCPEKSALVIIGTGILWFIFSIVPTRFVILCGGLGQYIATFMTMLDSKKKDHLEMKEKDIIEEAIDNDDYNPVVTRIMNFFMSIPTNEDLRRCYFWETRRVGDKEREIWAEKRRTRRLTKLYQAQWFGKLELKTPNKSATENDRDWDWISIFAIIQGHRFVWWKSEKDFDNGENPAGQIFFAGHSGLASLSPLELRELEKNEIKNVVNIFGRGSERKGQLKISLLVSDDVEKEKLESAVLHATLDSKND